VSTFSETNFGNPASGASVAAMTELANAYSSLVEKLNRHINAGVSGEATADGSYEETSVKSSTFPHDIGLALKTLRQDVNNTMSLYQKRLTVETTVPDVGMEDTAIVVSANGIARAIADTKRSVLNTVDGEYQRKITVDGAPIPGSSNPAASGGIYDAIAALREQTVHALNTLGQHLDTLQKIFNIAEHDDVWLEPNTITYTKLVQLRNALVADLRAVRSIDFTTWKHFRAVYGGTGSMLDTEAKGLYIVGELSNVWDDVSDMHEVSGEVSLRAATTPEEAQEDLLINGEYITSGNLKIRQAVHPGTALGKIKSGRLFLKYENSKPFDAIVDVTYTKGSGSIVAQTSVAAWPNMKFHLLEGTDSQGMERAYIALSADSLPENSSFQLFFYGAGINVIPGPTSCQSITNCVAECSVAQGLSISGTMSVPEIVTDAVHTPNGERLVEKTADGIEVGDATMQLNLNSARRPTVNHEHDIAYIEDISQSTYWQRDVRVMADTLDELQHMLVWVVPETNTIVSSLESARPDTAVQRPGIYTSDSTADFPSGIIFGEGDIALVREAGTEHVEYDPTGPRGVVSADVPIPGYCTFDGSNWALTETIPVPKTADGYVSKAVYEWVGAIRDSDADYGNQSYFIQAYIMWAPHYGFDDSAVTKPWSFAEFSIDIYRDKTVQDRIDDAIVAIVAIQPDCADTEETIRTALPEGSEKEIPNPACIQNLPWVGIADVDGGDFVHPDAYMGYKIDGGDFTGIGEPNNYPLPASYHMQNALVRLFNGKRSDMPEEGHRSGDSTWQLYQRVLRWATDEVGDHAELLYSDGARIFRFIPVENFSRKTFLQELNRDVTANALTWTVRGVNVANANANEDTEVTFVMQSSVPEGGPTEGDTYPLTYTTELIEFSVDGDTAIVRSPALEEITNELLSHLRSIDARIIAEAAARSAADTTLQEHIDAEASTREAADTTLQANIDSEASSREAADTTLQANIDAEAQTRADGLTALQNALNAEASTRETADAALQANIDSEASFREAADTTLQEHIDAEAQTRTAATTALQNALDAESKSRKDMDSSMNEAIMSTQQAFTTLNSQVTELQERIDTEASSREAADTALQRALNTETAALGMQLTTLRSDIAKVATTASALPDTAAKLDQLLLGLLALAPQNGSDNTGQFSEPSNNTGGSDNTGQFSEPSNNTGGSANTGQFSEPSNNIGGRT